MSTISHISPQDQLKILKASRYEPDLVTYLPQTIVDIIHTYNPENIGPNADNWYKALDKIQALPQTIPPLPLNIHEILTTEWIFGGQSQRVTDTTTLWLIPGGMDIDRLAELCGQGITEKFLSLTHPDIPQWCPRDLRTSQTVQFKTATWILVTRILPESLTKEALVQQEMIKELSKRSFLNFELPSFKYVFGAHLLKMQADGGGLWTSPLVKRQLTRVEETNIGAISEGILPVQFTLTVGSHWIEGSTQLEIGSCPVNFSNSVSESERDPDVGVVAINIGFSSKKGKSSKVRIAPKSAKSKCTLS